MHAPATVTVSGISQDTEFTRTYPNSDMSGYIFKDPGPISNGSFTESINATGDVTSAEIKSPNHTVSFGNVPPSNTNPAYLYVGGMPLDTALAANPYELGWNYQSFGVWQTGWLDDTNRSAGAMSVGADTPPSAVPTTGTATFTGQAGGLLFDGYGRGRAIAASLNVAVDFAARSATLSSGTMASADDFSGNFSGFNLNGALSYAAGKNTLTGTLRTGNGLLSGSATARFYGPAAQEFGGVFTLTGPQVNGGSETPVRFIGGFGAVRSH